MQSDDLLEGRARTWGALRALARASPSELGATIGKLFVEDTAYHGAHPINELRGRDALLQTLWQPLKRSFPDLERRDDILIGDRCANSDWLAATGYYYGTFSHDWLGIPATHDWTYIRYGEFYRLEAGRIVETYALFDFVDLMRQAGVYPLPPALGVETLVPSPASRDGIVLTRQDPRESARSLELVEAMIFDGLLKFDGRSSASIGMERYWDRDMMWYGPGGIGTTRGLSGFLKHHQEPFQNAFPDWKGEIPFVVADGHFVAAGGWPSIRCTHTGIPWLGVEPSGRSLTMRVMDWWRRDGDWLVENWIFIDIPDILQQLDIDLFALAQERAGRSRR